MKLTIKNNIPNLTIDNFKLKGWKLDEMPPNYYNQEAIVFHNDQEDETLDFKLYEIIKGFKIKDFVNRKIEFAIDHIWAGKPPKPLDKVPYPFSGITIGISNNNFLLRFHTIQQIGLIEDDWNKIWTNEFYFDNLSKISEQSNDLKIKYSKDDIHLMLEIEYISSKETIELAVNQGIDAISKLLTKLEYSIQGLEGFFDVIEIWDKRKNTKNEKFWHNTLKKYSWILSIAINEPALIFENEAFIGGKSLSNKSGNIIDFIYKNKLSNNIALIEIKTPSTKILGRKYRSTFSISSDCTGSMNQLLNYKESLQKNYFSLFHNSTNQFNLTSPNCYLIIGSQENMNKEEKESFELFRKNSSNIVIITFDELFEKVFFVLLMLRKK